MVTVNPIPNVNAGADQAVCENTPITLTATGASTYTWSGGVVNGTAFQPPVGVTIYTVTGTAAGCTATDAVQVTVNQAPTVAFAADEIIICEGNTVVFTSTSSASTNCVWQVEGMNAMNGCGPISVVFPNAGMFDVTLTVTDNIGCQNSLTQTDMIEVVANPIADFSINNSQLSSSNPTVQFTNQSVNASQYEWIFGDGVGFSTDVNPVYKYAEDATGSYTITLVAHNALGCTDTIQRGVHVLEDLIYYVPNTFTPDDDEHNQGFTPVFTQGFDPYNYHLMIYDRWGEMIFESFDSNTGWDGTYGGVLCQQGMYTWKIEFKIKDNDERKVAVGHVNLLR